MVASAGAENSCSPEHRERDDLVPESEHPGDVKHDRADRWSPRDTLFEEEHQVHGGTHDQNRRENREGDSRGSHDDGELHRLVAPLKTVENEHRPDDEEVGEIRHQEFWVPQRVRVVGQLMEHRFLLPAKVSCADAPITLAFSIWETSKNLDKRQVLLGGGFWTRASSKSVNIRHVQYPRYLNLF